MGEKATKPKTSRKRIYYKKVNSKFDIYTLDPEISKSLENLGIAMTYKVRDGCFRGRCEILPESPHFIFTEQRPKKADLKVRGKIERLFKKKLRMQETIQKMYEAIDEVESEITELLIQEGIKLKPSALKDSQLFIRNSNYKVHYRECIKKIFDLDMVFELRTKYPILEKAIRRRDDEYVDKVMLKSVIQELPSRISSKIVHFEKFYQFHEPELDSPECIHCGGQLRKDKICKNCTLDQKLT